MMICFDIGGTFIKCALVNETGRLFHFQKVRTPLSGAEAVLQCISDLVCSASTEAEIAAVGIASAGQISPSEGIVTYATDNLPGFKGLALREKVERMTGYPCIIENDVNATAFGELNYGAAVGFDYFLCLTLGTGVGGAIICDNRILRGVRGSAGEFGHMILMAENGRPCNCGNCGCYEQYASVEALKTELRLHVPFFEKDSPVESVFHLFGSDETVTEIIDKYIYAVGYGIVNLVHIFNPPLVLIGGAISKERWLIEKVRDFVLTQSMPVFAQSVTVRPTKLGEHAALLGIAALAQDLTQNHQS